MGFPHNSFRHTFILFETEYPVAIIMQADAKRQTCYGTKGRVKVVMASRFGDVGITGDLTAENGYDLRVPVEAALSNFSEEK